MALHRTQGEHLLVKALMKKIALFLAGITLSMHDVPSMAAIALDQLPGINTLVCQGVANPQTATINCSPKGDNQAGIPFIADTFSDSADGRAKKSVMMAINGKRVSLHSVSGASLAQGGRFTSQDGALEVDLGTINPVDWRPLAGPYEGTEVRRVKAQFKITHGSEQVVVDGKLFCIGTGIPPDRSLQLVPHMIADVRNWQTYVNFIKDDYASLDKIPLTTLNTPVTRDVRVEVIAERRAVRGVIVAEGQFNGKWVEMDLQGYKCTSNLPADLAPYKCKID